MIPFFKMHGAGNDFVMLDGVTQDLSEVDFPYLAKAACDRRFGVGSDGLILVARGTDAPFRMTMWNPDGSDGGMCGNGTRCVLLLLEKLGLWPGGTVGLEVGERVVTLTRVSDDAIRVEMGRPGLTRGEIGMLGDPESEFMGQPVRAGTGEYEAGAASMGNPHLVLFLNDLAQIDLPLWGKELEHHELFPNRTNAHFVQVLSRGEIKVLHWERGAGATLACGSGCCATVAVAQKLGKVDAKVVVHMPGGRLVIERATNGELSMTGPAVLSFRGVFCSAP